MKGFRVIPLTLRGRLLSGILVLVTLGLVGTDIAAYVLVRSLLDQRIDGQLNRTVNVLDRVLARPYALQLAGGVLETGGSGEINVLFLDRGMHVAATLPQRQTLPEQAALVEVLNTPTLGHLRARAGRASQLDLAGTPYRVMYHQIRGRLGDGEPAGDEIPLSAVVVALSFAADQDTLNQLAASEVLFSVVFLLILAGLALVVLRLGLRPLGTMAATATAIATGDPTRRVPVDRPRTEVGQLAIALNHAFDERRRAEERLRRFIADASHELRTPLTTIRGWADLYFQDGLPQPSDVETAMSRIAEGAGQVGRLVEELLLLARLDEQRPLDTAEVELAALVAEVVGDAKVVDPSRPITFSAAECAGRTTVVGDADRLRQVVRNLVGNALQHTPSGTPIQVTLQAEPPPAAPAIRLTVADAGPGIAEPDQEHLFERFYRANPGRRHTGAGNGLGLGLAIVRAIVEAHRGTVRVDSRPGEGTRFHVTLPVPVGAEDRPAPAAEPARSQL
jgi:two-component system OmpR family sensor kinase